ncbi:hypothetical protein KUV65_01280 [Maritalea mobilis]|uniref:sensor histidine kinase n=1 Tax=Maritalea mobilis TaxID=483324 RepID=UPI001C97D589|nr:ATP-binding protein [Maritalea mobilis]MBY6199981.1 hypothetical protein [Maritalea mobilis]
MVPQPHGRPGHAQAPATPEAVAPPTGGTGATRDFHPQMALLIEADGSHWSEIIFRWLGITAGGFLAWVFSGDWLCLAWIISYLALNAVYLVALSGVERPVGRNRYLLALLLNFSLSGLYTALPVYLVTFSDPALHFIGIVGFLALALHNLVQHRGLGIVAVWDQGLIVVGGGVVANDLYQGAESGPEQVMVVTGTIILMAYFLLSYRSNIAVHNRLSRAERLRAEGQKMEAVGRLTGGVAHDFNNILTVILGNLDLYREIEDRAERDQLIDEVEKAARRAATLTAQLLAFSRRATLLPETIRLPGYLDGLGAMLNRVLPANVDLEIHLPAPMLTVHADPNLLSTALLNLVINARDAMPDGGTIEIYAERLTLPTPQTKGPIRRDGHRLVGEFCAIHVRDTGPGIPPDMMEDVLHPFVTTKPLGQGSGLGLSMVLGFAEQTRGTLLLENRPEGGLQASLVLPATGPNRPAGATQASPVAQA